MTNTKAMERILVAIILYLFVLSTGFVYAAPGAPKILNYQGHLTDDQGKPVTADKQMEFRIYAAMDDAPDAALWASGNVTVHVVNGHFSVNLGDPDVMAPFPDGLFVDDSRFLGISVDGSELIPRKRLLSVPYALNVGAAVPSGAIVMWSGSVDHIPQGWALCNGQNGTPDLRDRFIVGAGGAYAVGATGGTASNNLAHSHTVNAHTHSIALDSPGTNVAGSHHHHLDFYSQGPGGADPTDNVEDGHGDWVGSDTHSHRVVGDTWDAGAHSHIVNAHNHGGHTGAASPGTSSALSDHVENRPPYYALCFIMKL